MSLPEGWVKFAERWDSIGARKWFGDHYKEVVVDGKTGDLEAATTAVDREVALRAQASTDAANAHADSLEAQAAAVRETGDVSATVPSSVVEEVAPAEAAAPPYEVPPHRALSAVEEIEAEQNKLDAEIKELTQDSGAPQDGTTETPAAPAA